MQEKKATLVLKDGSVFHGFSFGAVGSVSGEIVFNTGMMGYPESMTDPSYRGQIIVMTYPLVGNYGVPPKKEKDGLHEFFESQKIQCRGIVISDYSFKHDHHQAERSLSAWMEEEGIPGIYGIDTRELTKKLREKGTMLGKIVIAKDVPFEDPGKANLVAEVSIKEPIHYGGEGPVVVVIDCGIKNNIIRSFTTRGVHVIRVPWDYDFSSLEYDGLFISNGPGDPTACLPTITNIRKALKMKNPKPIWGICLGNQLLALAAGGRTYKLTYGHRSQNQPCVDRKTGRCYITSQNHGYAVDTKSLPEGWEPWFENANDGTNEGIRHKSLPFFSVQFHPEAAPGPVDTEYLFDTFIGMLR